MLEPRTLFIMLAISFCCIPVAADSNPFIEMVSQPYAVYSEYLEKNIYEDPGLDSLWVAQTVARMRETAQISGHSKWMLEADFFEAEYRYGRRLYVHKPAPEQNAQWCEELIADLIELEKRARAYR